MILRRRVTVKRSFTIPELYAGPVRIGAHRPPSTKAGLQEAIQQYREHRSDITLMETRLPDLPAI